MKRIGILGDIGSGKTFVAKCFGYPCLTQIRRLQIYIKKIKNFIKIKKSFTRIF